jgi:hypothetical protein
MPDLFLVFSRRWKFILGFTILAAIVALAAALFSPKKYLSVATALPANSVVADKARIFNPNIEALYSDFGSPDELDRLEGTALLDTIFISTAQDYNLPGHYLMNSSNEGMFKAAMKLKANSSISRSGYGELKIKVWDVDPNLASEMANSLLQKIQELHQHLQNESNRMIVQRIKEDLAQKAKQYESISGSAPAKDSGRVSDTASSPMMSGVLRATQIDLLREQIREQEKLVSQYQFAINTNPPVLLVVEKARPALYPDKPRVLALVLFTFFGALLFFLLLAFFLESRKPGL